MPETVRAALGRAHDALDALQELGEEIEDEWTYVTDLGDAWRSRIDAAIDARGNDLLPDERVVAIDRAVDEIGRISDPHRAIDWLSTFPQVVLVAAGERP